MNSCLLSVRYARRLLTVVGVAMLVLSAAPMKAQRPALVKNSDEPGRMPYSTEVQFYYPVCGINCTNFTSFGPEVVLVDAIPAVPAGKRLIIRHISGTLATNATCGGGCSVGVQTSQVIASQNLNWFFAGPFFTFTDSGLFWNSFSADVFVTVEPGQNAHLRLFAQSGLANGLSGIVLTGYLIDATN